MTDTTVFVRKALELGLRQVGVAPEMVQARRLVGALGDVQTADDAARVLIFVLRDWSAHVQWEALLAHALRLRGAVVEVVSCGGGFEVCDRANTYESPPPPCGTCDGYVRRALGAHGLDHRSLADLAGSDDPTWPELDEMSLGELCDVEWEGVPLGRIVEVPAKWFLCNSDLEADPLGALTVRRFLRTARRLVPAVEAALDRSHPDVVVLLNGLFLSEAIAAHLAERRGIRVVSYERGFIQGTLFFSHGTPATRYWIPDRVWERYSAVALSEQEARRLDEYLADRRHGRRSHVDFWPTPTFDDERLRSRGRRVVAFTNLTWDSAVIGTDRAYESMTAWLLDVIAHLGARGDTSLLVRVHPAEVRLRGSETREPIAQIIHERLGPLPGNVTVVGPDDPLSSYTLMERCDVGLVYSSTTGLELALAGKPVLVAGSTHYAGRGFTLEADSPNTYRALLDAVVDDPGAYPVDVERARRYANMFFFAVPVPQLPTVEPLGGLVRIAPNAARLLPPGADAALDRLCECILSGTDFGVR